MLSTFAFQILCLLGKALISMTHLFPEEPICSAFCSCRSWNRRVGLPWSVEFHHIHRSTIFHPISHFSIDSFIAQQESNHPSLHFFIHHVPRSGTTTGLKHQRSQRGSSSWCWAMWSFWPSTHPCLGGFRGSIPISKWPASRQKIPNCILDFHGIGDGSIVNTDGLRWRGRGPTN